MILFFDTETTGLPEDYNAPASDTDNWPRMVQLAYILYQRDGTLLERKSFVIKPNGYTIPPVVSRIHGITTKRAIREGVNLSKVLTDFQTALDKAAMVVAHNMDFDEKIIGSEYYRIKGRSPLTKKKKFCTMKATKVLNYCALPPFRYGNYKWPQLHELHYKLFNERFEEAHNAAKDIIITAKCFWELKERGIINIKLPKTLH